VLLMLKSVLKQRVNIQFCILNEIVANPSLIGFGSVSGSALRPNSGEHSCSAEGHRPC
jgi:hypothetical protein